MALFRQEPSHCASDTEVSDGFISYFVFSHPATVNRSQSYAWHLSVKIEYFAVIKRQTNESLLSQKVFNNPLIGKIS